MSADSVRAVRMSVSRPSESWTVFVASQLVEVEDFLNEVGGIKRPYAERVACLIMQT